MSDLLDTLFLMQSKAFADKLTKFRNDVYNGTEKRNGKNNDRKF